MGIHVVGNGSWKKREVGKFEVRKFPFKLESTNRSWKVSMQYQNFPTSARTFQLYSFQFYFELFNLKFPATCITTNGIFRKKWKIWDDQRKLQSGLCYLSILSGRDERLYLTYHPGFEKVSAEPKKSPDCFTQEGFQIDINRSFGRKRSWLIALLADSTI